MSFVKQALLCIVLVALAAGGWYAYQNPATVGLARETAEPARDGASSGGRGNRIPGIAGPGGAVNVITAAVARDAGGEAVMALGTAEAARSVILYPQVTGIVTEIGFAAGQPVQAGAVLVRLEDDEQQVALERARVTAAHARDALARAQKLAESKTISTATLSDAESASQLGDIEVRSAEIELGRRSVTAPFAGVTGITDVSVGDLVTTTTEIATLEDLSTLKVRFEVPERWAGRIEAGQAIVASPQGMPGVEIPGKITGIDSSVDAATRTLRLEAELANEGRALMTGMAVTVGMRFDSEQRLAVPTLAIQWDRRGSFVWKIVEEIAHRAAVAIVKRESGVVIVEGEIAAGDRVVVEGIHRLREGTEVADVGAPPVAAGADGGAISAVSSPLVSKAAADGP